MRRTLLLSALLLLLTLSATTAQGISLDIKTRFSEKNGLIAVKHGVISAIEKGGLWEVVEFGEDFSLWLTDLRRSEQGDSTVVELGIELRTPALVRSGDLIERGTLRLAYSRRALDSLTSLPDIQQYIRRYADELAERDMIWKTALGLIAGKLGGPLVAGVAGEIATAVVDELRHAPTPAELCEGTLVGVQALGLVGRMLKGHPTN